MARRTTSPAALLAAALAAVAVATATATAADDFAWLRGVNWVPSTSHNDVATWQDYDAALAEAELGYAAAAGFNAVRVFLSTLPWLVDASAFRANLAHFVATLERFNLTSQLVVFDSCFGDVNANVSWISSGLYKNFSWIPNPGPAVVADPSAWTAYDAYLRDVVEVVGASRAVLVWDLHNEPDFGVPHMVDFIAHTAATLASLDARSRPRTVGVASSGQQGLVQDIVTMLSFHNYDGGGGGVPLARDIAAQRALGERLGKPVILTETMSRPNDLLTAVLPAVFGCINVSSAVDGESSAIGWFVWELMLGVDQFNDDWSAPYQGLLFPSWAPGGEPGGSFRYPNEQTLLSSFLANATAACLPSNSLVPDTSPAWAWAPADLWTAWSGAGPPLGTLHYANAGGAVASIDASSAAPGVAAAALVLVHKRGPDCGILSASVDGAPVLAAFDTYQPDVDWAAEVKIPLPAGSSSSWVLDVTATGARNSSSSNSYVQIVGLRVE